MKSLLAVAVVIILIVLALKLWSVKNSHRSDISRSLDQAADNIDEGIHDAKRSIQDAMD
ncbi:hypothetical protein N9K06_00695 [Omnitrophica bacterium]|nr:hypothetical protein [Candidatus Omnitrophota bacterium]